jgi:hypothetical protein
MTQAQVDTQGEAYYYMGYTREACDSALFNDGATQYQVTQFHFAFDNKPGIHWPGEG